MRGDNQGRQMVGYRRVRWRRVYGINSYTVILGVSESEDGYEMGALIPAICGETLRE